MKVKRDRIFVAILALVTANLSYLLIQTILILLNGFWGNPWWWFLAIADVVAIAGTLWLLESYRRGRRIGKDKTLG